jgi:hypothetical protein
MADSGCAGHHQNNKNEWLPFQVGKGATFQSSTYFKENESSNANLYVDFQRTELTLHDGSILTFPSAQNNIPYMLTDWQPVVGITL